jgi:isopenicillin-N epimerase
MPFGRAMLESWLLDPEITYLNHGTVGATPRAVLAAQNAIRDEIERQPSRFLLRELAGVGVGVPRRKSSRLRAAAAAVAAFVGVPAEELVLVDNATTGVNAVLQSLSLEEGDELLLTDHAYGSVARTAAFVARRRGARVRTVTVPFPLRGPSDLVEAIDAGIGPRTRVAVIDHITSLTALVFPVVEIAAQCRARGVPVLVDGAHAPGAVALDVASLGVDWYGGNLHKWAFAPRPSGFLWAAPGRQSNLHAPVVSWGFGEGFPLEFEWASTRDPSALLAAPAGIAFLRDLDERAVRDHNHGLAREGAARLVREWGTHLEAPPEMFGAMVTLPLPDRAGSSESDAERLRDALLFEERIEVQLHAWRGRLHTRISAQVYNDLDDIARLSAAVLAHIR